MQDVCLRIPAILEHAARVHGGVEIVSRSLDDGTLHRYTYRDACRRSRQLAAALHRLGIQPGDRVATLAWNSYRHFESWYAISGQAAICHTVNPRLFPEQIQYIMAHAEDTAVLLDACTLPLLESLIDRLPSLRHVIVMTDRDHMPSSNKLDLLCYEELLEAESEHFTWPDFPETTPSSLCYTSGTTGDPKGVLYTHRSNVLCASAVAGKGSIGVAGSDSVLMLVPMFHANSWGLAYTCPMVGAKIVFPGNQLDGKSVAELMSQERITFSAAVPTVWYMLLNHLKQTNQRLDHLQEIIIGGSAVSRDMIETFDREHGVRVVHAWGMTETSPLSTIGRLSNTMLSLDYDRQVEIRLKQGHAVFGSEIKIVDDDGNDLPHDGTTMGRLMVRGPWVVQRYYRESEDAVDHEGWLDTGDIATIDTDGYMQITDRAKDLIKSGGEWISSVQLEHAANEHLEVAMTAVIAKEDPKWDERPFMLVKRQPGSSLQQNDLRDFLSQRVARWWLPDEIYFVDEIPLTATGKINKRLLRQRYSAQSNFPRASQG